MANVNTGQEVWVIIRFEQMDGDVHIVDVCDSDATAKLALEADRQWILGDDYKAPVDPDDDTDDEESDEDYGYEWTVERRYIATAADFK